MIREKVSSLWKGWMDMENWLGKNLPLNKIYYTLLVVYLSIATNDIQLPQNSILRKSYFLHIVVVFILSYLSLGMGNTELISSKILSASIVTSLFYFLTRPEKYTIFDKNFYFKTGDEKVPIAN